MALLDTDFTVTDVRDFRDNDGHVFAQFATVAIKPAAVAAGADEPAFSGASYANIELHLDNGRNAQTVVPGAKGHLTLDIMGREAE